MESTRPQPLFSTPIHFPRLDFYRIPTSYFNIPAPLHLLRPNLIQQMLPPKPPKHAHQALRPRLLSLLAVGDGVGCGLGGFAGRVSVVVVGSVAVLTVFVFAVTFIITWAREEPRTNPMRPPTRVCGAK
ncbi:hypothetical protein BDV95DRAFT_219173 [Massariosphaeria phaeospora]|uniref:Uncharacterized protein n=1 Tax=Massariosphaeria phaeospora TaxID=100035 RepID=A0A7C8MIE5_9PLEO|nr:hypothetical protein BDV95DRAFT_219173 [Massariosphaeria phaeospora]